MMVLFTPLMKYFNKSFAHKKAHDISITMLK